MPTLGDWDAHFKTLTPEKRDELRKALRTLESDPLFKGAFDWTGMFALKYSLKDYTVREEEAPSFYRGFRIRWSTTTSEFLAYRNQAMMDVDQSSYQGATLSQVQHAIDDLTDSGEFPQEI